MSGINKVGQVDIYDDKKIEREDNKEQVSEGVGSIFDIPDNDVIEDDYNNIFTNNDKQLSTKEVEDTEDVEGSNPNEVEDPYDSELLDQIAFLFPDSTPTITKFDNGTQFTEFFNDDGSGYRIIENFGEEPFRRIVLFNKGHIPAKEEYIETTSFRRIKREESFDERGNNVYSEIKSVYNDGSSSVVKIRNTYNENDLLIRKEWECTDSYINVQEAQDVYRSIDEYEYYPNSDIVAKKVTTNSNGDNPAEVTTSYYDTEGKITFEERKGERLILSVDESGKLELRNDIVTETTEYKYNSEGKKSEEITRTFNLTGQQSETITQYAPDGETIVSRSKTYYKNGAKVEERYDGANIENRDQIPSQKIEYEQDGVTIKQITINHFDEEGILIGRDIFDKDGNKLKSYDFSEINGNIELSNQISRGDCYLLAAINALAMSDGGQEVFQQNIHVSKDEEGKDVYTVTLPGASNVRWDLMNEGVDKDKILIQGSYTVTEDELKEAAKKAGIEYSSGDKDVLLLEVVYEKYRQDVDKTKKAYDDNPKIQQLLGMRIDDSVSNFGDYLCFGCPEDALYVLTGKKPAIYQNANESECPVCYIDDSLQMHLTGSSSGISDNNDVALAQTDNPDLDTVLNFLEQDCSDGTLDNYGATASLRITSQEVNGQTIVGGGHAFAITKVDKDNVYLSNPWNPEIPIIMSKADFAKAIVSIAIVPVD